MSGKNNPVGREVKAAIPFVIWGKAKKDTTHRTRGKFMGSSGGCVWIAEAAKDTEMLVRRRGAEEGLMRSGEMKGFGGKKIKEMSGHGKGFDPVGGRHGSLEKERANDIVDGTDHTLSSTVLS